MTAQLYYHSPTHRRLGASTAAGRVACRAAPPAHRRRQGGDADIKKHTDIYSNTTLLKDDNTTLGPLRTATQTLRSKSGSWGSTGGTCQSRSRRSSPRSREITTRPTSSEQVYYATTRLRYCTTALLHHHNTILHHYADAADSAPTDSAARLAASPPRRASS